MNIVILVPPSTIYALTPAFPTAPREHCHRNRACTGEVTCTAILPPSASQPAPTTLFHKPRATKTLCPGSCALPTPTTTTAPEFTNTASEPETEAATITITTSVEKTRNFKLPDALNGTTVRNYHPYSQLGILEGAVPPPTTHTLRNQS